jgi:DNA polymerase III alpha subunit (gram-positive type)
MNLIIFDLETTGFSPSANEIIQIAAVKMRVGRPDDSTSFSTFVRPTQEVPWRITELTGITQRHVQGAPSPVEALLSFSRFVGEDATLVAHNGQRFDMPFIRETCVRHRMGTREVSFFDSMALSKKVWGSSAGHGLDAVMERLNLSADGVRRHDARGDVAILAEAVRRMWEQLSPDTQTCPVDRSTGVIPSLA